MKLHTRILCFDYLKSRFDKITCIIFDSLKSFVAPFVVKHRLKREATGFFMVEGHASTDSTQLM